MRGFFLIPAFLFLACGAALAADAMPAAAYFPVLPFDAPPEQQPQLIPLAASHAIDGPQTGVTRAIIAIHDASRDANNLLAGVSALAGAANGSTIILAPQFLLPSDIQHFSDHLPGQGQAFAAWQISGWPVGDDSQMPPGQKGVSSFTVVDLLLMYLSDRTSFPDLKTIIIAGYGEGAAFVQRYAALGVAAPMLAKQQIDLRYIVAGAPSYLYVTATRPLGGQKGFGRPDPATCPDYDSYPYGLDKLNFYGRRVGANAAKTDYAAHTIAYLNTTLPDPLTDNGCAALAQGPDTASRAANFQAYLQSLYGDAAAQTQNFALFKDARNDAVTLFGSPCGMAFLFGDAVCARAFGEHP